jgi:hypothetical protein
MGEGWTPAAVPVIQHVIRYGSWGLKGFFSAYLWWKSKRVRQAEQ